MKQHLPRLKQNHAFLFILLVVILVSTALYTNRIFGNAASDYGNHIEFAYQLLRRDELPAHILSHPLFQIAIAGLYWITRARLGMWHGSVLVLTAANLALCALMYIWLGNRPGRWNRLWRAVIAGSLAFVGPVTLLAPLDGRFYFGYIGMVTFHNPTVHILRPLALAGFIAAIAFLSNPARGWERWKWILFSAAAVITGALAKPSWAVCLLPAAGLLAAWRWLRREPMDWAMLIFGIGLPSVAVLAWQAGVAYLAPDDSSGILLMPFAVEAGYSGYLGWKFLLSILFPLSVLILSRGKVLREPEQALAWLAFLAGTAQMYLLAEGGNRLMDGNFRWGAQVSLMILFAANARYLWRSDWTLAKSWPAWLAFLAHLAGGISYAIVTWQIPGYG